MMLQLQKHNASQPEVSPHPIKNKDHSEWYGLLFWWRQQDTMKSMCRCGPARSEQGSTGALHLIGSSPAAKPKRKTTQRVVFLFGGDNRTRTCDLMRVKHAL